MDKVFNHDPNSWGLGTQRKPVVCISFHWDGGKIAPEAGNAFDHYKRIIPELASCGEYTLIGHGHPRIMDMLSKFYAQHGIEVVRDFEEIMQRADLYVNDCSSTLYEFCATGKPVIILNAPWFRKNVSHGIRFWEYTDVGPQVDRAEDLPSVINEQLSAGKEAYELQRAIAVQDLYPYWGCAAARAAEVIQNFVDKKIPRARQVTEVGGESIGVLYMCFGKRAAAEVEKSMQSLKASGLQIPICVVGDTPVPGTQFIEWKGQSPFDPKQREGFQFRAGRVKPFLYELSPFERTLYIDADTEFVGNIMPGFECLGAYEMAQAEELLEIGKLYNRALAGWEINIIERDETIKELGGNRNKKFMNSGVIFFKKCEAVKALFEEWGRQWLRWQQWDEQLALMRAMHICPVKLKTLSVDWNHPHRKRTKIIFHNYGRGTCRSNVDRVEEVMA